MSTWTKSNLFTIICVFFKTKRTCSIWMGRIFHLTIIFVNDSLIFGNFLFQIFYMQLILIVILCRSRIVCFGSHRSVLLRWASKIKIEAYNDSPPIVDCDSHLFYGYPSLYIAMTVIVQWVLISIFEWFLKWIFHWFLNSVKWFHFSVSSFLPLKLPLLN